MKRKQNVKYTLPQFKSEDEERDFWAVNDASAFFTADKKNYGVFPNLKYSTETISIRLPMTLLNSLKLLANRKDVPYQSLIKMYLDEKVKDEMRDI